MSYYPLEAGTWKDKLHVCVHGEPCSFYIYIRDGEIPPYYGASKWINDFKLYHKLRNIHKKSKKEFIEECYKIHKQYRKG